MAQSLSLPVMLTNLVPVSYFFPSSQDLTSRPEITGIIVNMSTDSRKSGSAGSSTRSDARELVLRMLYQLEVGRQSNDDILKAALAQSKLDERDAAFATELFNGISLTRMQLDIQINDYSKDWDYNRLPVVDRNILRLAVYELSNHANAPAPVICNEAVELAKKYSTQESSRYINGILGALIRDRENQSDTTKTDTDN